MTKCSCFRERDWKFPYGYDRCYGTKEVDPCDCGGYEEYCDFYPEKREKAREKLKKWQDAIAYPPAIGRPVLAAAPRGNNRWEMQTARRCADGRYYIQVGKYTLQFDGVTHWSTLPDTP